MMNHEVAADRAAANILAMLDNLTPEVVRAALRLAYTTGAHDQAMRALQEQIAHDERVQ